MKAAKNMKEPIKLMDDEEVLLEKVKKKKDKDEALLLLNKKKLSKRELDEIFSDEVEDEDL